MSNADNLVSVADLAARFGLHASANGQFFRGANPIESSEANLPFYLFADSEAAASVEADAGEGFDENLARIYTVQEVCAAAGVDVEAYQCFTAQPGTLIAQALDQVKTPGVMPPTEKQLEEAKTDQIAQQAIAIEGIRKVFGIEIPPSAIRFDKPLYQRLEEIDCDYHGDARPEVWHEGLRFRVDTGGVELARKCQGCREDQWFKVGTIAELGYSLRSQAICNECRKSERHRKDRAPFESPLSARTLYGEAMLHLSQNRYDSATIFAILYQGQVVSELGEFLLVSLDRLNSTVGDIRDQGDPDNPANIQFRDVTAPGARNPEELAEILSRNIDRSQYQAQPATDLPPLMVFPAGVTRGDMLSTFGTDVDGAPAVEFYRQIAAIWELKEFGDSGDYFGFDPFYDPKFNPAFSHGMTEPSFWLYANKDQPQRYGCAHNTILNIHYTRDQVIAFIHSVITRASEGD